MATADITSNRNQRRGADLEKFKRRMIRSVARRMREKMSDDDVWADMKKEVGSNCKNLWERMRTLTLKKLKRLLESDDRVCNIGPIARMNFTDWLLFDLVIVHEKIDVIDREKLTGNYRSNVLSNLFSLVQRFEIEGRTGDDLAEAWMAATVYYNSKGHQCSPMMLQRRWYQIKELTRHKFYKFWFKYRGNSRQLITAKQDSPSDLQRSIALKYPQIITANFETWEERIEKRLVILPDELGVKMRQRHLMKPSDTTAPDVVLVEPQIECINLGANSDSEENEVENDEVTETLPIVKIKSEPVDQDIEKEHEVYLPPEKGSEFEEEIERLQMVEENFDTNPEIANASEVVVIDPEPSNDNAEGVSIDTDDVASFSIVDGNITNVQKNLEVKMDDGDKLGHPDTSIVNDEETESVTDTVIDTVTEARNDIIIDENIQISDENDCDIVDTSESHIGKTVYNTNGVIAEISSVTSAGVKIENMDDVIESDLVDDNPDAELTGYISEELTLPVISTVSSEGIKVEKDLAITDTVDNDTAMTIGIVEETIEHVVQSEDVSLPVISTVSSEAVKLEIEIEPMEDLHTDKSPSLDNQEKPYLVETDDDVIPIEDDDNNEPTNTKVNDLGLLGDVPMDLNFADDCIDFADDGIAYVDEDEEDIITITDPQPITEPENVREEAKEESDESKDSEEDISEEAASSNTKASTFDLKLLMCPVVYTTKLDAMTVFEDSSEYEQVYDKELIDTIFTLSKPVSKQSIALSSKQEDEDEFNDVNNHLLEDNNDTANASVSDDDLFSNKAIEESDSESEIIDDSKRVKLSSYLLNKPKNRTYNPVLLCKNPDFNTRLKKLSVGFFMSARNRTLLQSCIPMTIDMSKAFEDKLINGTLYLKPTPNDLVINIQDDVEVTSAALVKPTAVQQSLMNIDDTLENELKKCMAERVRAINLPDISQVRRLNQHLLTAEVTPLRLENKPENIQNIIKIAPIDYVQNIKKDIDNLLSQQKTNDVSNNDVEVIPENKPEDDNSSLLRMLSTPSPMVSIPLVQPLPPAQPHAKNTTPSTTIPTTTSTLPSTAIPKVKIRKPTRRTYYPQLAWNKRPHLQEQRNQKIIHSDALLTLDTLYKILSALDPCSTEVDIAKKKKKKLDDQNKNEENLKEDKKTQNKTTLNKTNQNTIIDITDDEPVPVKKPKPRFKVAVKTKDKVYCCWCNYRIALFEGNVSSTIAKRRHRCKPGNCICCCREEYITGGGNLDVIPVDKTKQPVKSIADEEAEKNISKTIQHVVQLVNQMKTPKRRNTGSQIDMDNNSQEEPSSINESMNDIITKTVVDTKDETVQTNENVAELTPLNTPEKPKPIPTIRVYSGVNGLSSRSMNRLPETNIVPISTELKSPDNIIDSSNLFTDDIRHISQIELNTYTPPSQKIMKRKAPASTVQPQSDCTCLANISKVKQGTIEINGSNNCSLHKKPIKESKIILSKKLITEENQPFFVGRGKILLSNLKFPAKVIEPPPPPQSEEVESIRLPAGVQIVLLPDQTLTYVMEPDVTLTPEECEILPQFLVAIQQQINAIGVTLPTNHHVLKTEEVIDLDSDEPIKNSDISTVANRDSTGEILSISPPEKTNESISEQITEITASTADKQFEMDTDCIAKENHVTPDENFEGVIDAEQKKNEDKLVSTSVHNEAIISDKIEVSVCNEENTDNPGHSKDTVGKEALSTDDATNKKSLLSDLMEMSGIMEEDLAPPPLVATAPIVQNPIILDTSNFILQRPVPQSEVVNSKVPVISVPSLSPITAKKYSTMGKDGKIELTPVTSFTELKYSYDNKALFFKLDLESGHLSSINVCIQKCPKSSSLPSEKTVIDLTDDLDISITGTETEEENTSPPTIITKHIPKKQISTILQKKKRLLDRLSNNLKPVNIMQSKRHLARILKKNRNLLKDSKLTFYPKAGRIQTQIDLVDSDTPMEEEYLVNSSGDSSDDEPLFKKAKRMRSEESSAPSTEADKTEDKQEENPNAQELNEQDNSGGQEQLNELEVEEQNAPDNFIHSNDQALEEYINEEHLSDDYVEQEDGDKEMVDDLQQSVPVPTNLVLSGGALNAHNIPLNTTYRPEDDSQDEDCILGV